MADFNPTHSKRGLRCLLGFHEWRFHEGLYWKGMRCRRCKAER